jgi:beta-lactamase regulating signal transducer with metallopeptidase domain
MRTLLEIGFSNAVLAMLLAIPAALAGRLFKRPALAHALWILVFVKLIIPSVIAVPVYWPELSSTLFSANNKPALSEGETPGAEPEVTVAGKHPAVLETQAESSRAAPESCSQVPSNAPETASPSPALPAWELTAIFPWIGLLWLGGSLCWFGVAGYRVAGFQKLLQFGQPAPESLQQRAAALAQRLGLSRCPQLWIVPGRISPLLWALGWPVRLVLPAALLNTLSPEQQETLLTHELAHAQRQDHWVRWLEVLVTGIYWWHPVVWWARHELHLAEEQCCDAWVVWTLPRAARIYARALLQTVEFLDAQPALPPVASGIGHVQLLKRRLRMIVQQPTCPRLSWLVHLGIAALALLVLPLGVQQLQANNLVPDGPVVRTDDDASPDPRPDQDRLRDLDRRLRALETRLDRVLRSVESRSGRRDAARSEEDSARREADRKARQAEERARDKEREAKQKVETKMREVEKKLAEKKKELEKQALEFKRRYDDGPRGVKEFEWRFEGEGKFDPEKLKALEQQIESAVKEAVNPERMKRLEKQIQESLDKNLNPERMKQLQAQIEESVKRSINPERLEGLARQIESTVQKSLAAEERERARQAERAARAETAAKGRPRSEPRANPDSRGRDLERRMDQLEERMNRLLEALEKDKSSGRR